MSPYPAHPTRKSLPFPRCLAACLALACSVRAADPPAGITHSFLATGAETYIRDGQGNVVWSYPASTRDGWVLPSGNILLTLSKSRSDPGGGVIEVERGGKVVFQYNGKQSEVNTAEAIEGGYLISEAGDKPRLLEVDRQRHVTKTIPLKAQTNDHHLQTRMARKLKNGNYLVPQLLDRVVREYTAAGEIVWEVKTPNMPFTAIRLPNGNTVIACTRGDLVIEVDASGKTVWQVSNDDLPGRPIHDACGIQRLPNGNTVIASYGSHGDEIKLLEVGRDKSMPWVYRDGKPHGIHQIHILDTNGRPVAGKPFR
jgi:hypothetical protein